MARQGQGQALEMVAIAVGQFDLGFVDGGFQCHVRSRVGVSGVIIDSMVRGAHPGVGAGFDGAQCAARDTGFKRQAGPRICAAGEFLARRASPRPVS